MEHEVSAIYSTARQTEIWSEDFSNGIPADWENSEMNGIASFEYRGPATNPDIYIGSRGSCIPEGSQGSDPIDSETWANGFVIFDSNYWDDNIGPCSTGFGTGPSPAPHLAMLTTPSIDLSAETDVMVMFHQFYKQWPNNADAYIEYSVNGGEWTTLYTVTVAVGNATPADQLVVINISEVAGGAEDFKLRYTFEGSYYYWMIDDLVLFQPATNDMVIMSSTYGDFDVFDQSLNTGFENMEYTMYADEMTPLLQFHADVINAGAVTQNGVTLNVEVVNNATSEVVYSASSAPANMASQAQSTLTVPNFQMPSTMGEFSLNMTLTQDQEDENPDNNFASHSFNINDVMYARDHRETEGIYIPGSIFINTAYEIGNMFLITADDIQAHSVSVGIGLGSTPGSEVYGAIYKLNLMELGASTLLAQTSNVDVYYEALNNFGENKTMVIEFDEPVTLQKDSAYLVVAGAPGGGSQIKFATSGETPAFSSWLRFMPNQWFYMIQHPMVRVNFGEVVGIDEQVDHNAVVYQNYPNPFDNSTQINFSIEKAAPVSLLIRDCLGRTVDEINMGTLPVGSHNYLFERGDLAPGLYTYTLTLNKRSITNAMVVRE